MWVFWLILWQYSSLRHFVPVVGGVIWEFIIMYITRLFIFINILANKAKNIIYTLQVPTTADEWRKIADSFYDQWNCIGAMDGKHIVIMPPPNSSSYYFNCKHTLSIVLLAIVDADFKFV